MKHSYGLVHILQHDDAVLGAQRQVGQQVTHWESAARNGCSRFHASGVPRTDGSAVP
jgi:hypothetical protein